MFELWRSKVRDLPWPACPSWRSCAPLANGSRPAYHQDMLPSLTHTPHPAHATFSGQERKSCKCGSCKCMWSDTSQNVFLVITIVLSLCLMTLGVLSFIPGTGLQEAGGGTMAGASGYEPTELHQHPLFCRPNSHDAFCSLPQLRGVPALPPVCLRRVFR